MSDDPALDAVRAVRRTISHEHGDSARSLVEYYMDYQNRFGERLRFREEPAVYPVETGPESVPDDPGGTKAPKS
jgi:hypothetical protein